jgi:hypothetical protein
MSVSMMRGILRKRFRYILVVRQLSPFFGPNQTDFFFGGGSRPLSANVFYGTVRSLAIALNLIIWSRAVIGIKTSKSPL